MLGLGFDHDPSALRRTGLTDVVPLSPKNILLAFSPTGDELWRRYWSPVDISQTGPLQVTANLSQIHGQPLACRVGHSSVRHDCLLL